MQKFVGDIKKRWLTLALLNMLMVLTAFGALSVGFGFYAVSADKNALKKSLTSYADRLCSYELQYLQAACSADASSWVVDIDDPNFIFALYTVRGDGSYGLSSKSSFLKQYPPILGGNTNHISVEVIGGHKFMTLTLPVKQATGNYIKVLANYDAIAASIDSIKVNSSFFAIAFVVVGVILSLIWSYFEIKPAITNYYKQKNFINDISHEIRTPLAIIKGNLENALATPDVSVDSVSSSLETCLNEVDYMTDMSSGLLNIVRNDNKTAKKDSIISETLTELVDMYTDVIAMDNKSLVACIDRCDMQIDREKIKQLLSVLFENAIKYTRDGDRINVKLKNTKDGCVLTVSDTGIGVAKEELELIFDRFYRAENAKDIAGTGLGLAIAKTIVESMNGTIKAMQNVPHGLEILIVLKRTGKGGV